MWGDHNYLQHVSFQMFPAVPLERRRVALPIAPTSSLKSKQLGMDQEVSATTSWSCNVEIKPSIKGSLSNRLQMLSKYSKRRSKGLYDTVWKSPGQTYANPIYTLWYKVILKSHFPSFTLVCSGRFFLFFFFSFDEYTTKRTLAD